MLRTEQSKEQIIALTILLGFVITQAQSFWNQAEREEQYLDVAVQNTRAMAVLDRTC